MKNTIGVATFLLASVATLDAHADVLNWNKPAFQFDTGARPAVVLGTGAVGTEGPKWEVAVHEGGDGYLWYSWGWATGVTPIALGGASREDYGFAPAVASVGPTPNGPIVLEVHQGASGLGPLWGHLLTATGPVTTFPSFNVANANAYDSGYRPAVAAAPISSDESMVVEVHQGSTGAGPLWYHMGSVYTGTSPATLAWSSTVHQYDSGAHPSVAITTLPSGSNPSGIVVVEVHQGGDGFGPLWYRSGVFNQSNWTINWNNSHQYDYGVAPAVVVDGDRVFEVHQGTNGFGPLWYHTGVITGSVIVWDANAYQYDSGDAPAVAWSAGASMGLEVHQGTGGAGPLWRHAFTTQPAVPYYAEAEDNWCWLTSSQMVIDAVLGAYEDPVAGNPSYAATAECGNANLDQALRGGWGPWGSLIDCCVAVTFNSNGPCNRGGDAGNILADHGIQASYSSSAASFGTLQSEIAAGRPVPFDINWNDGSGSHIMVVTGTEVDSANNQWVLVNDPKPGYEYTLLTYGVWSNANSSQGGFTLAGQYTNVHR